MIGIQMSFPPLALPVLAQAAVTANALSAAVDAAQPHPTGEHMRAVFLKLGMAILLGLLVGLEREWAKATDKALFAGIRTFPFIALLGCTSALISEEARTPWFFGAAFASFMLFVSANHFVTGGTPGHGLGTTTEIMSMLMFMFGGLVYWGHTGLAAALTVACTVILSIKQPLHELAQRVESQDIYATLKLAVVSVIILPLLPDQGIHVPGFPYLEVLNPQRIWLLVVLVSAIAFVGYVSSKVIGPHHGIALTGLLGGIVSSTAVAIGMAERSHEDDRLAPQLSLAVILSSTVLFVRTIVEVAIVNGPLAGDLVAPLLGASLFGVAASAYLWFRGARSETESVTLRNPFSLVSAVKFGLLFAFMLVLTKFMTERFDRAGMFAAAGIGGLVDARPIALTVANLALRGDVSRQDAVAAIMLGCLANTVMKCGWAAISGAPAFRRMLLPSFLLLTAGGVAATVLVIKYGPTLIH